jgi:phosphate-selective porin OprO/OprP
METRADLIDIFPPLRRWTVGLVLLCAVGAAAATAQTVPSPDRDALRVRLDALERELAEVRAALTAPHPDAALPAPLPGGNPELVSAAGQDSATARLDALDQQVRVLDRKFELERERVTEAAKTTTIVDAGKSGFALKSPDGNFNLRFRGLIHADSRWYLADDAEVAGDTFITRRVRPILQGTMFKVVDVRFTPDFGDGRTVIQDAYVDLRVKPMFRVRGGKFKTPFGLERLASAADLTFMERGAPTALAPNRDTGLMLWGEKAGAVFSYGLGVFDGVVDGGNTDLDEQDGKDVVGRVFVQPFVRDTDRDRVQGLGFGIAVSYGEATGTTASPNLATYRTTANQTFFRYRADTIADGTRSRVSPQAYYYSGRLGLLTEFTQSRQDVRRGTVAHDDVQVQAWQVAGSWVLTGERATYRNLVPRKNFDPAAGTWGAFEVAARYHQLSVGDEAFPLLADPSIAAGSARVWTAGLNWYLNPVLKVVLDYEETRFEGGAAGGGDRPTARDLFTRLQVGF